MGEDEAFAGWRQDEAFRKLAGPTPKKSFSREEGWNYDLDFFVAEIRRMHYSFRTHPLPAGFDEGVHQVHRRIPQVSDAAMRPAFQRLLARFRDDHTRVKVMPSHE